MRPRVLYAASDGVSIAYQVVGSGGIDLVFQPGFVSHLDLAWEEPFFTRFLEGLAGFARVIWFDKRGTGLSDPAGPDVPVECRLADIRAVMDAAGARRAALFGISEGAALSAMFAAADPGRVSALILWGGFARLVAAGDGDECPGWSREFFDAFLAGLDQARADGTGIGVPNPSIEGDERYRDWFVRYVRAAAGPGQLRQIMAANARLDLRPVLRDIEDCLRVAMQAPLGANALYPHFVVVTDPAKRTALAGFYIWPGSTSDPGTRTCPRLVRSPASISRTRGSRRRCPASSILRPTWPNTWQRFPRW